MPLGFLKKLLGTDTRKKAGNAIIVDDDQAMRELLEIRLGELEYNVIKAETPGHAIAALAKCISASLFVISIKGKLDDGITLARSIREREDTRRTPIILVSGDFSQSDMDKVAGGIDNCAAVIKPFSARKFSETLGTLKKVESGRRKKSSGRMPSVKGSYAK